MHSLTLADIRLARQAVSELQSLCDAAVAGDFTDDHRDRLRKVLFILQSIEVKLQ